MNKYLRCDISAFIDDCTYFIPTIRLNVFNTIKDNNKNDTSKGLEVSFLILKLCVYFTFEIKKY